MLSIRVPRVMVEQIDRRPENRTEFVVRAIAHALYGPGVRKVPEGRCPEHPEAEPMTVGRFLYCGRPGCPRRLGEE